MAALGEVKLEESSEGSLRFDDQDEQYSFLHDVGGAAGRSAWWIDARETPPVAAHSCDAFLRPAEQYAHWRPKTVSVPWPSATPFPVATCSGVMQT